MKKGTPHARVSTPSPCAVQRTGARRNTEGISEIVTRDINRGLTVDVFEDRMVIDARDFGVPGADGTNDVNDVVRSVTIPNPLVK